MRKLLAIVVMTGGTLLTLGCSGNSGGESTGADTTAATTISVEDQVVAVRAEFVAKYAELFEAMEPGSTTEPETYEQIVEKVCPAPGEDVQSPAEQIMVFEMFFADLLDRYGLTATEVVMDGAGYNKTIRELVECG